jgi:transposase-like protein
MGGQNGEVDKLVARLATKADGVVLRRELLAAGLSERQVDGRLERGALIVEFPGLYRVGHRAPSTKARYLAAVKACGEGAVLSGLATAWLYGLVGGPAPRPEVTTPKNRTVDGILPQRSLRLDPRETTIWKRIPVATVPRTLVDLPSHRGRHAPRNRKRRCAHYVDCRWPEQRLTVELDSYRFHRSRHAWEQERDVRRSVRAHEQPHALVVPVEVIEEGCRGVARICVVARRVGVLRQLPRHRRCAEQGGTQAVVAGRASLRQTSMSTSPPSSSSARSCTAGCCARRHSTPATPTRSSSTS